MNIDLKSVPEEELSRFREKMRESFEQGVLDHFGKKDSAPIPSGDEVREAFEKENMDIFWILLEGTPCGGAIIQQGENQRYSLDIFFIFREFLNRKIGFDAWQKIESNYPNAELWETHTPYFERRNIHFYVNKCRFQIVEFFCESHREETDLQEEFTDRNSSGFFRFEKRMK